MTTVWEDTLMKSITVKTELNWIDELFGYLPGLPHSFYFLNHGIHRFFARVEPILIIRVHEALRGVQDLINLVELPLLMVATC
jgi:hypothetical protein